MNRLNSILLVDDDHASNYVTSLLIEKLDLSEQIHIFRDGKGAMQLLQKLYSLQKPTCPDLILLDINMPIMNGFEFLEQLKQIQPLQCNSTRIVFLTSSAYEQNAERLKQYNIEYITKPLTEEKLVDYLERYGVVSQS